MQKITQFLLQSDQIDGWRRAALEIGYLAVNTAPVACIIGVEIDTDGYATCAAGNDRINVGQSRAVTTVVILVQSSGRR